MRTFDLRELDTFADTGQGFRASMSFDTLAPFYRVLELFTAGGKLQRCRTAFLGKIPVPRKILLAGEGHGRFLPECVKWYPEATIVMVDISARMLEIARRRVVSERVEYVCEDFLDWNGPSGEFDLIVTNFFLDCFPEDPLALVVAKLGMLATPEANWLLADFEIAPTPLAGLRSRVIVGMLYAFFQSVCGLRAKKLVPPDKAMRTAGFSQVMRETYEWGLLKSEWWQRIPVPEQSGSGGEADEEQGMPISRL